MKPFTFYIASSLENHAAVRELADRLIAAGHYHTYDWTKHGSVQAGGEAVWRAVAQDETNGVVDADVVIVLLPGRRGTHVEFGIALGRVYSDWPADKIIIVGSDEALLEAGRTCIFYHHPSVQRAPDVAAALALLGVA